MRLLIGTQNALVLWEDGRQLVVHSEAGAYYGITWSEHEIFIVARGRHPGRVLRFDDTLFPLEDVPYDDMGPPGYSGPHQAHWSEGKLYTTNTQRNRIEIWDGKTVSSLSWSEHYSDHDHINSIWQDPVSGLFYVVEHRRQKKPKRIRVLSPDLAQVDLIEFFDDDLLEDAPEAGLHNAYVEDGMLFTLGPNQIIAYDLKTKNRCERLRLPGTRKGKHYLRGLARSYEHFFIGRSRSSQQSMRGQGSSEIVITDPLFGVRDVLTLSERFGQVFEVRCLDQYDFAHNGIMCPLSKGGNL